MGRVTFQDAEVAARVNRDFSATWKNCRPGYRVEHLEGERFEQIKKIPNGQANENVATLLCTADGELLHVVAGHWKPQDFIAELDFALAVAAVAAQVDADGRRKTVAEKHRERLASIERTWDAGLLGRKVIEHAHRRMMEQPLRAVSDVKGVTDYAVDKQGDVPDSFRQKLEMLHQSIVAKIEPLVRAGKIEEAERVVDRLLERIKD